MLKRTTHVFIVTCTIGILFLALSTTATAKKNNSEHVKMPEAVKQALVRELGTDPKITSVKSRLAANAKHSYDEGSIGRKLTADEWRES